MIVKLQRPLAQFGTKEPQMWLAYPLGRDPKWLIPADELPRDVLAGMGQDLKAYFEATVGADGKLLFGKRIPARPW
jgi:hypothetical protein